MKILLQNRKIFGIFLLSLQMYGHNAFTSHEKKKVYYD